MTDDTTIIEAALVKAQGMVKPPHKNKANPHFKSTYANLPAFQEAIREANAVCGLALVHTRAIVDGHVLMRTLLIHNSGTSMDMGVTPLLPLGSDPQKIMAAETYAKRGAISGIYCIAGEDDDDDGNTAAEGSRSPIVEKALAQAAKKNTGYENPL